MFFCETKDCASAAPAILTKTIAIRLFLVSKTENSSQG